jgi:hypothetical protein
MSSWRAGSSGQQAVTAAHEMYAAADHCRGAAADRLQAAASSITYGDSAAAICAHLGLLKLALALLVCVGSLGRCVACGVACGLRAAAVVAVVVAAAAGWRRLVGQLLLRMLLLLLGVRGCLGRLAGSLVNVADVVRVDHHLVRCWRLRQAAGLLLLCCRAAVV